MVVRARVYIDGFNLYYGAVRSTNLKWLDLEALCARLLPGYELDRILYFTARIRPAPWDPDAHLRQATYLKALEALPSVEIVEGKYSRTFPSMRLLNPRDTTTSKWQAWSYPPVFVWRNEEKGSDVSLGARLVFDGCQGRFDEAVIVSNDSDLLEPVRLVKEELGIPVHAIMPANPRTKASRGRRSVFDGKATSVLATHISWNTLKRCQLPDPARHPGGPVAKPIEWR